MKKISTLEQLTQFTLEEAQLRKEVLANGTQQVKGPNLSTINAIMAYSKSLSIRKSEHLGHLKMVLN